MVWGAACWLAMAGHSTARMLELLPSATASGPQIMLGDVVRHAGSLPAEWAERVIFDAPAPREELTLTLSEIATALSAYADMRNVVLRGHRVVRVTSPSQHLEVQRIDAALADYLEEHPQQPPRRFRACREPGSIPPVPRGDIDIVVTRLRPDSHEDRMMAQLDIRVNGESVSSAEPVWVPLVELRPFWATTRPLTRGAMLTESDLEVQWADSGGRARHYPATEPIAGMELRRGVPAGRILTADMLTPPVYVRRGEMVRIVTEQGGLTVSVRARALQDGRRDELIGCVNERSGRRMYVRLVRPREAVLELMEESSL